MVQQATSVEDADCEEHEEAVVGVNFERCSCCLLVLADIIRVWQINSKCGRKTGSCVRCSNAVAECRFLVTSVTVNGF